MRRFFLLPALVPLALASCADAGDSRSFSYYLNERYQLRQLADLGDETPFSHAYFSQYSKHETGDFVNWFDKERSVLELRVKVENGRPFGYGFVQLFRKDSDSPVLNLEVLDYHTTVLSYQGGSFFCSSFDEKEPLYFALREWVRFRVPFYIDYEQTTRLLTFEYSKILDYPYPEEFKDLTWLL